MRKFKHIAAFALSAIMAVSLSVTALAADTVTMYRDSKSSKESYVVLKAEKGVIPSSIKTGASWLKKQYIDKYSGETEYLGTYKKMSPYSYGVSYIGLVATKPGTAKVSYKVGSKTYSKTVKVLDYTNPIKSITVPAINNGKNMASKLDKSAYVSGLKVTDTKGSQTVKVTAKPGWKIVGIYYGDVSTDKELQAEFNNSSTYPTTASLYVGKITKGTSGGYIGVYLINTKTDGELYVELGIPVK